MSVCIKKCYVSQFFFNFKTLTRIKYSASPNMDNVHEWICVINGPRDTPYEGGTYFAELRFSAEYPIKPPSCSFLTKIYHMNVTSEGKIEMPLLKTRWKATNSITDILDGIYHILEHPEVNYSVVPELAALHIRDQTQHNLIASQWCEQFAK